MGDTALEPTFSCAQQTTRIDDIVTFTPFSDQVFYNLGQIL
jgi:hypothetical protein